MDTFLFAARTSWHVFSNEISTLEENLRSKGISLINLSETNPTRCDFSFYKKIDFSAIFLNEIDLNYAPVAQGAHFTRSAIMEYYRAKQLHVSLENIFLTASSSESYSHLMRLFCDNSDEIVVPSPSYPLLEYICSLNDVVVKQYDLKYDGEWRVDFDSVKKNINHRTKAIVIINPNNPTGSFLNEEEWLNIQKIAEQHSCAIILDEVFTDYTWSGAVPFALHANPNVLLFRLNGISKMLALPQGKLGWISIEGKKEIVQKAANRLEIICDTFLSVNTAIQSAFPSLMKYRAVIQTEISHRIQSNYFQLQSEFQNTSVAVLQTQGGWCAILRLPNLFTDEQWVKKIMQEENVIVHPGYFYDCTAGIFIVVSLVVQESVFHIGIQRIKNNVENVHCRK
jgi:aspartate/methionine/tyrosine aminotransferase